MELQDVINRRRMVRRFRPDPVPHDALDRLLHNATRAPSAGFSQGQAFLVLQGKDLDRFWPICSAAIDESVATAPLVIVALSSKRIYLDRYAQPDKGWTDRDEARWPVPFWHTDTAMAGMLVLLTAVDEGLGALYFGITPAELPGFRTEFGVPADHTPVGAIAVGYDAETEHRDLSARRRPRTDVIHHGNW